ncbi:MAG: ABC transporter substrate-binding protein [Pseudomonadota bacterium]
MSHSHRILLPTIVAAWFLVGTSPLVSAEEEIVVGAVLTLSGEGAQNGEDILEGLQHAVDALNGIGGIEVAGVYRPVRLEVFDDQGSDRRAVALARVLVLRRDATVVVAGSRPSAGIAIAPIGAEFRRPMIDVIGLPTTDATDMVPYHFSVLPSLEDRWMPAITFAVLVRRLQGSASEDLSLGLVAGDDVLRGAAQQIAAGWGLQAVGEADGHNGSVVLLLDPPRQWQANMTFGSAIVIVPACRDAIRLRQSRPTGAILCTALWRHDAASLASESALAGEIALLAVAQAIARGRTAYGQVLRDVLMLLDVETPIGPIRFGADGRNVAIAARLYAVEADGLHELDPADPSSLWRLEP